MNEKLQTFLFDILAFTVEWWRDNLPTKTNDIKGTGSNSDGGSIHKIPTSDEESRKSG